MGISRLVSAPAGRQNCSPRRKPGVANQRGKSAPDGAAELFRPSRGFLRESTVFPRLTPGATSLVAPTGALLLLVAAIAPCADAQQITSPRPKTKTDSVRSTSVEIVLLTTDSGGALQAQQWRAALEPLEIPLSIRSGSDDEKIETTEKTIGTLRKVTAVGELGRSGKITFADRSFQPGERQKIKQWIDDLKTYGAQGTPEGKPLWGLTEEQFAKVYEGVTDVSTSDSRDKELTDAIAELPLPAEFPIRWTDAAKKQLARGKDTAMVRQSTQGFTVATALAVMLRDHGLGFRPARTPAGTMELVIERPENAGDVWPVGWPLKLPRQQAAPGLFKLQQVFFDEIPLQEVLAKGSQATKVPMLFDYTALDRHDEEWASVAATFPLRQATWHTVIKDVLNKRKLTCDLWQDEAGRPFLDVTTVKSRRAIPSK